MYDEHFQFRPPNSPFEVAVILKELFSWLPFSDLANCRQVSKLWDLEASKQLWKVSNCRIPCRWTTVEQIDLLNRSINEGGKAALLVNTEKILDTFRSRISSSSDSRIAVRIESPPLPYTDLKFYRSHYHDIGRTVHGFLTNPVLCNLLASIELDFFADFDVVLRLLSELPNLREFILEFDVKTFLTTQSVIPQWHKTSPIHNLDLYFSRQSTEFENVLDLDRAITPEKLITFLRILLGGCVDLRDLRVRDRDGKLLKAMDANFLKTSLTNPQLIRVLELRSFRNEFIDPEKLRMLTFFPNITHLDLLEWGVFDLENWKDIISRSYLPPGLSNLNLRLCNEDPRAFPKQLLYHELQVAGLDRLRQLTRLRIQFHLGVPPLSSHGDWIEEWKFVEGSLALVRARIIYYGMPHIDLRPHKHLRDLTLRVWPWVLAEALQVLPPTVKQLDVGSWNHTFDADDNDFIRNGALKALKDLERFRVSHSCHQCTEAILEHVFAEMKSLRFVQLPGCNFTEEQLEKYRVNIIFSHERLNNSDLM